MFFSLSSNDSLLLLLPPTHNNTSMASRSPRLLSLARRAFSSSSSQSNGVSLVQGASRGIGLEFVRFFFFLQNQCFFPSGYFLHFQKNLLFFMGCDFFFLCFF
jgi:hypothetical protein